MSPIDKLLASIPKSYIPNWSKLKNPDREDDFSEAAFHLVQECGIICTLISDISTTPTLNRNSAINTGLAVRLTKLTKIITRDLSNRETFQQLSIARQIFETASTLVYLLNDDGSGERYDKFVQDSLVAEKIVLGDITRNIKDRNGYILDIESRMRVSIGDTAKAGGIEDINSLPQKKYINFPKYEDRLKLLGANTYIAYRISSSEVHGTWTDLFKNHLKHVGEGFLPNFDNPPVRPHIATTTVSAMARVFGAYLDKLNIEEVFNIFNPILDDIIKRNQRLIDLHESYLATSEVKKDI